MGTESKFVPSGRQREVFLSALEKPPAERAAFLEAACAGDSALRRGVDELLREQEKVGSFLETPAISSAQAPSSPAGAGPGGTALIATVTEKPGDHIDRYKLLQKIGEGGCGVVYMAEQEEPVRRRVALKVIKLGMDTKSVIARFEAERQALAMMDHPNIAKVFDAGATETGRPFFVMELVRGIRITEYCDQNNLPTETRLKLFIQVCQAIQHAHQKGIIHRDIKPSNILVTLHDGVPVPKVIDFGIAKATEQRLTKKTLFTEFTAFIGTPAYMSPEQAEMSGLDIDTRSDIYSLGVLLYELLIGRTPFDAEDLLKAGLDECRRTIREVEPARPSTRLATMLAAELTTTAQQRRTDVPKLIHLLRGDLDWIAMKCLEKDRTRRYATANDLVLDIQRYLEGETVFARPPSNVYRLKKLLRRHRGAVAAAASIAAALLIGISISIWQAVRATRAEHRAETAQELETHLRQQAEFERERAEQEEAAARLNEYVADINLAQQSLAAGNYGRAVQLLDKHRPQPGEPDLRGFEWRYLWQLSRGDEHVAFPTQDGAVHSLALSPAGDLLAIGLREKFALWNLRTKSLVASLPKGSVSMAFLPDGKGLLTASHTSVRVWNTADWTEQKYFPGNAGPLALSDDGSRLAVEVGRQFGPKGAEGVRVWDTSVWNELWVLPAASGPMAFSPDGKTVATDSRMGITLWSVDEGRSKIVLEDSTNLFAGRRMWFQPERSLAFSPDGQYLVAARNTLSDRGVFVLSVWDVASGKEQWVMPDDPEHIEHTGLISALAFSPDGFTLATASMDYSIRLWNFTNQQRIATFQGHLNEVWSLAFAPDGRTLVSGAKNGEVKLWPTRPQRKDEVLAGLRQPLAFSKDGRTLAALAREGAVVFVNVTTGETEQQFPLERNRARFGPFAPAVSISQDLRTLAQGCDDGTVKLWDTGTREATALKVCDGPVELVALSPDAQRLITRGRDWTLRRWDLRTGSGTVWTAEVFKVLFSPDGHTLATFGRGNSVQFWDAASLSPRTNLVVEEQLNFPPPPAAFSPDGRVFALAAQDDTIRLWEAATAKPLGTCTGHKQGVSSIVFSPDGKTLATASDDSTLKLWNLATQQELLTIRRLGGALRGLLFSPDGQLLVGGSSLSARSGGLRLHRAPLFSTTDAGDSQSPRQDAER